MEPDFKCGTFKSDKENGITPEIRKRMDEDRAKAEAAPPVSGQPLERCKVCGKLLPVVGFILNSNYCQTYHDLNLNLRLEVAQAEKKEIV